MIGKAISEKLNNWKRKFQNRKRGTKFTSPVRLNGWFSKDCRTTTQLGEVGAFQFNDSNLYFLQLLNISHREFSRAVEAFDLKSILIYGVDLLTIFHLIVFQFGVEFQTPYMISQPRGFTFVPVSEGRSVVSLEAIYLYLLPNQRGNSEKQNESLLV